MILEIIHTSSITIYLDIFIITNTTKQLPTMLIRPRPLHHRLTRPSSTLTLSAQKAQSHQSQNWLGTCTDGGESKQFIDGQWVEVGDESKRWFDVRDPVSCSSSRCTRLRVKTTSSS
jgi:hypothetical protein